MASVETNDKKRLEMSELVTRCKRDFKWSTAQLAVWMGVTPGTVNAWARAKSMGTNAQRNALRRLGSLQDERLRILDTANSLEREALTSENLLEEDLARDANAVAKFRRNRIARIRLRVVHLRELFA